METPLCPSFCLSVRDTGFTISLKVSDFSDQQQKLPHQLRFIAPPTCLCLEFETIKMESSSASSTAWTQLALAPNQLTLDPGNYIVTGAGQGICDFIKILRN